VTTQDIMLRTALRLGFFCLVTALWASSQSSAFTPLQRWRTAILAGDASGLAALYSNAPPSIVVNSTGVHPDVALELTFWAALKKSGLIGLNLDGLRLVAISPQVEEAFFQAELVATTPAGPRNFYFFTGQVWVHEGEAWKLVSSTRTDLARLKQPNSLNAILYPPGADAHADLAKGLAEAARSHRRVLVEFGGNWCYDCHVLDMAFDHSELTPLLEANYVVVRVDVGEFNRNLDIAKQYGVPLEKGVPAIVLLDSSGKLLFSSQHGEFESARRLGPSDLIAFLNEWKGK